MKNEKMSTDAKARPALPDSANRPKTKVAGMTKKNTRMKPVLREEEGVSAVSAKTRAGKKD